MVISTERTLTAIRWTVFRVTKKKKVTISLQVKPVSCFTTFLYLWLCYVDCLNTINELKLSDENVL